MSEHDPHPCLTCGACCATFRVSVHWSETDPALGGVVPAELTEPLDHHQVCMRGTWQKAPRCVALDAIVGEYSRCTIHPQRPSVCRLVNPGDPQCIKARELHGLPPITDWQETPGQSAD